MEEKADEIITKIKKEIPQDLKDKRLKNLEAGRKKRLDILKQNKDMKNEIEKLKNMVLSQPKQIKPKEIIESSESETEIKKPSKKKQIKPKEIIELSESETEIIISKPKKKQIKPKEIIESSESETEIIISKPKKKQIKIELSSDSDTDDEYIEHKPVRTSKLRYEPHAKPRLTFNDFYAMYNKK